MSFLTVKTPRVADSPSGSLILAFKRAVLDWMSDEGDKERVEEAPDNLSTKEEKERCSGSYCQAVGFLVIKDDSISERPG